MSDPKKQFNFGKISDGEQHDALPSRRVPPRKQLPVKAARVKNDKSAATAAAAIKAATAVTVGAIGQDVADASTGIKNLNDCLERSQNEASGPLIRLICTETQTMTIQPDDSQEAVTRTADPKDVVAIDCLSFASVQTSNLPKIPTIESAASASFSSSSTTDTSPQSTQRSSHSSTSASLSTSSKSKSSHDDSTTGDTSSDSSTISSQAEKKC